MKKIKIGIFGPGGRMGSDLLEQIENFNLLELAVLCEKEKHKDIGKTVKLSYVGKLQELDNHEDWDIFKIWDNKAVNVVMLLLILQFLQPPSIY